MSIAHRIAHVRAFLADAGLDGVLVTNPSNRRYLTGFTAADHAADESAGVVLITAEAARLIVSPTNLPWAESEADIHHIAVEPYARSWVEGVADRIVSSDAFRLAVEDRTTPASYWFALQESLPPIVELVRAGDTIDQFRAVKSDQELALLREAARMTDEAFLMATAQFSAGVTESQAAELVRESLRHVGSEGEAFDTIVASGPNAAKPHHHPGTRVLCDEEPIIVDMGARIDGYNGDLTRTVCLGKPDEKLVRIYEAVLAAQHAGLEAIRANIQAATPDLATREVFAGQDLEQFVIHSAGHGLGLRVHEAPSVRKTAESLLATGNVVTMEPGLYIPNWGGVRIEDVAIVCDSGHENITSAPKGIESMTM